MLFQNILTTLIISKIQIFVTSQFRTLCFMLLNLCCILLQGCTDRSVRGSCIGESPGVENQRNNSLLSELVIKCHFRLDSLLIRNLAATG